jgi:phage recombination protein Bet
MAVSAQRPQTSVITTFARRFSIDASKVLQLLKNSVFRAGKDSPDFADEEVCGALVLCNEVRLNPFAGEITVFRGKGGKLSVIIAIDGWIKIVTRHPQYDGEEWEDVYDEQGGLVSVTCKMFRRDRKRPTEAIVFLDEERENSPQWQQRPHRMLRHRAYIQAARLAFGKTPEGAPTSEAAESVVDVQLAAGALPAPSAAPSGRMQFRAPQTTGVIPTPQTTNGEPAAELVAVTAAGESTAREPGSEG